MKALKIILYILIGLVALVFALGIFAKKTYHIERSIEIDAPKAMVYDQIRLFKNFHEWSPWSKLDPNMKLTYAGTDGQAGASYSWSGNDEVGEGKQTLKSATPDRLELQLDFVVPFESTVPVFFNISCNDVKSKVTWGFDPKFPFPINVWAMFTDIDKAMGNDYERGLGFLKRRCEGMAHKKYNGYEVSELDFPETWFFSVRKEVPNADVHSYLAENLRKTMLLAGEKAVPVGPPVGIFWNSNEEEGMTDLASAVPIQAEVKLGKEYSVFKLTQQKAIAINYNGDYAKTQEAHVAIAQYMAENKLKNVPPVLEIYFTDPASEPDTSKWQTRIVYIIEPAPDSTEIKK